MPGRVAGPPGGSINGNAIGNEHTLKENIEGVMQFCNDDAAMEIGVPPEPAPEWPVRPGKR